MQTHLSISLKVVIEHIDTNGEVSSVVRIRTVPPLRAKLAPLNHSSMEVDKREENTFELIFTGTHLQCVLISVERIPITHSSVISNAIP